MLRLNVCIVTLHRYATRRDGNEEEIVRVLRTVGAEVLLLTVFDLLVLFKGRLFMLDCKMPRGKITTSQRRLQSKGWPLMFVRSADDALRAIGL